MLTALCLALAAPVFASAPKIKVEGLRAFDLGAPVAELRAASDGRRAFALHASEPRLIVVSLDRNPTSDSVALPSIGSSLAEAGGKLFIGARKAGAMAVLDSRTFKFLGSVELPAARIRRIFTVETQAGPRLIVIAQSDSTRHSAAVAFVLDPADPKPTRGLRLADGMREFDAAVSAEGRFIYLWRTDASPSGLQVFDRHEQRRVFSDTRIVGPVRPDGVGLYAATRTGEVYTADFAARVAGPGEGMVFFHPTRPMLFQVAAEAGALSSESGLPGSVEMRTVRVLSGDSLRPIAELTNMPPMAIAGPIVVPESRLLLWLTARPRADGEPIPVLGETAAALVVVPFDPDRIAEADTVRFTARPADRAEPGRTYRAKLSAKSLTGGTVTFTKQTGPAGLVIEAGGEAAFTPTAADIGEHTITIVGADGRGSTRLTWTLRVAPAEFTVPQPERRDYARPTPGTALSADDRALYAINPTTREIDVRGSADGKTLRSGKPAAAPTDLAFAGDKLLVLDESDSSLLVVDPIKLVAERRIALGNIGPYAVAVAAQSHNTAIVFGDRDRNHRMVVVDLEAGKVVGEPTPIPFAGRPLVSPDGRRVAVFSGEGRGAARVAVAGAVGSPPSRIEARVGGVGPVDGRVYLGRSVYSPDLANRLGELPGEISVPHPARAVVLSIGSRANYGIPSSTPAAAAGEADDPYDSLRPAPAGAGERTMITLLDAAGLTPLAKWTVALPAAADDALIDRTTHTALIRCGSTVVRFPLPAELCEPRRYFTFVGKPAERIAPGERFAFSPKLFDAPRDSKVATTLKSAPDGLTWNAEQGAFAWTPTRNQIGRHRVALEAKAADGRTATLAFDLLVEAPRLTLPFADYAEAHASADGAVLVLRQLRSDRIAIVPTAGSVDPTYIEMGGAVERIFVVGNSAWVVVEGSDTVRIVDLAKRAVADTLVLKAHPVHVAARPGTREVYLSDDAGGIRRINTAGFVDEGVVARGRTFAFDPTGNVLYTLTAPAKLGFELPEAESSGTGNMILIAGGGKDDKATTRRPGAPVLKVYSPGESGRGGGQWAWVAWEFSPSDAAAGKPVPGAGALRSGRPAAAATPEAAVWGAPNSPWLLLDAVLAAEAPESFVVSPDGTCLLYVSEGVVKAVRTGDLSEVQAAVALKFRENGSVALVEPALSMHSHAATGRAFALSRTGRLYGWRKDRETITFEPVVGASDVVRHDVRAERPRDITIGGTAVETGLAAAFPGAANDVFLCRGADAVRTALEPAGPVPESAKPLRIDSHPPTDFLPAALFRWQPKPVAEGVVHRSLISGPEGMTLNPQTGVLSWEAPAGAPEAVRVVLHFKDKAGRSGFRSFVLLRAGPAVAAPAGR